MEPNDVEEMLEGYRPVSAEKGQEITFQLDIPLGRYVPLFDEISITQYRLQEETEVEILNNRFQAPEKRGKYYYLAHLEWDGELKGEGYYAFSMVVR